MTAETEKKKIIVFAVIFTCGLLFIGKTSLELILLPINVVQERKVITKSIMHIDHRNFNKISDQLVYQKFPFAEGVLRKIANSIAPRKLGVFFPRLYYETLDSNTKLKYLMDLKLLPVSEKRRSFVYFPADDKFWSRYPDYRRRHFLYFDIPAMTGMAAIDGVVHYSPPKLDLPRLGKLTPELCSKDYYDMMVSNNIDQIFVPSETEDGVISMKALDRDRFFKAFCPG